VSGDQLARVVHVARGNRVMDSIRGEAGFEQPLRRPAVQLREQARVVGLDLVREKIAEQVMVAVPLPLGIQRDQKEVGALDLPEHAR
jgi:hypothetical protein